MPKTIIYYHRSYRKITGSGSKFLIALVIVSAAYSSTIYFFSPFLTKQLSLLAKFGLSFNINPEMIEVSKKSFIFREIYYINLPSLAASRKLAISNLLLSILPFLLLRYCNRFKPVGIYFVFLSSINLLSSTYFIFWSGWFPYTTTDFSEFYVKSVLCIWLFLPIILGAAVLLLPAPLIHKALLILVAILYSCIFAALRYIVFLYIIYEFSAIYMAVLFFGFGPLVDFVYIVGIYSFYSSKLAASLKYNEAVWKWSY